MDVLDDWRSLFFIEDDDIATATLLFPPDRVLVITNAAGILYEEQRDYLVDYTTGRITRPADSRMPCTSRDELYPRVNGVVSHFSAEVPSGATWSR